MVLSKDEITGKEEYKPVVQTFVRTTDIIIEIILENGEEIDTTEEHPFWVVGIGWVEAKNLNANSVLVLAGDSYVGVESVEVIEVGHEITVYNFEVQDYHTYFVGSGIWVHNSCGNFAKGTGNGIEELGDGSFKITNWDGYPDGSKPQGPFKILEGEEYDVARKAANNANRKIHRQNPALKGKDIHEIHPVKFGGSPTDLSNKIPLSRKEHAKFTTWWNRLLKE
ncbi:MAG: hypothetical protein KAX49_19950 [Halanaerobiales bacterium]|nr:hypothetical protein [Halanaerobiales bacterium]